MDKRLLLYAALAGLLVAAGASMVMGGSSNPYTVQAGPNGTVYDAAGDDGDVGPTVHVQEDIVSTTIQFPFSEDGSTVFFYDNYWVSSDNNADLDIDNIKNQWTEIENLFDNRGRVTAQMGSKPRVHLNSNATYFRFGTLDPFDSAEDIRYSAPNEPMNVTIGGYPSGVDLEAVDENGDQLDAATVDQSGQLALSMPAGSNNVTIQQSDEELETYLTIREYPSLEIINQTQINGTFYQLDGNLRYDLNTTDGRFALHNLSMGSYDVQLEAQNYTDSWTLINTITVNHTAYMINQSAFGNETVDTHFVLDDQTGNFPPAQSTLIIRAPLTENGSTTYQDIARTPFGSENNATVSLIRGETYQVAVRNSQGATRVYGRYVADNETVTITLTDESIEVGDYEGVYTAGAEQRDGTIYAEYTDPEDLTDAIEIEIVSRQNPSNTITGPTSFGQNNLTFSYDLPSSREGESHIVYMTVQRDGETINLEFVVGPRTDATPPGLDPMWQQAFGIAALLVVGLLFSVLNRGVGAVTVGVLGGMLYFYGFLGGATVGMAVVIYLFVAIIFAAFDSPVR